MTTFGARLAETAAERGPLCVGIDPHPGLLARWGFPDDADGLRRFADACVIAFAGEVGVVKPQSAFFERHGSRGVAVLEWLLHAFEGTGTLTVLDAKRGDIGSTMDAYGEAYVAEDAPMGADALTVSPYLGFGSLAPALALAHEAGRGLFVLARTSNPEGGTIQLAVTGSTTVAQGIVDAAAAANVGADVQGSVGVVVGATHDHGLDLSALHGPVLVPGLGAQGATPADIAARFAGVDGTVVPAGGLPIRR